VKRERNERKKMDGERKGGWERGVVGRGREMKGIKGKETGK